MKNLRDAPDKFSTAPKAARAQRGSGVPRRPRVRHPARSAAEGSTSRARGGGGVEDGRRTGRRERLFSRSDAADGGHGDQGGDRARARRRGALGAMAGANSAPGLRASPRLETRWTPGTWRRRGETVRLTYLARIRDEITRRLPPGGDAGERRGWRGTGRRDRWIDPSRVEIHIDPRRHPKPPCRPVLTDAPASAAMGSSFPELPTFPSFPELHSRSSSDEDETRTNPRRRGPPRSSNHRLPRPAPAEPASSPPRPPSRACPPRTSRPPPRAPPAASCAPTSCGCPPGRRRDGRRRLRRPRRRVSPRRPRGLAPAARGHRPSRRPSPPARPRVDRTRRWAFPGWRYRRRSRARRGCPSGVPPPRCAARRARWRVDRRLAARRSPRPPPSWHRTRPSRRRR